MRLRIWDTLHRCARFVAVLCVSQVIPYSVFAEAPFGNHAGTPPGIPAQLQNVGILDKNGAQLPLDAVFADEQGRERPLREFLRKDRPVILNIVYYTCPSLCGLVLNATLTGLKDLQWSVGKEFDVISLSMDHREGYVLADSKKKSFLTSYGREGAGPGWHFLTGKEEQIRKVTDAVGFNFRWDDKQQEYAHGAGIFVLTPDGRLSRTLFGIQYEPRDLRLALLEAGEGKVGTLIDRVVLFCFRYDPTQKGYALYAFRFVQAGSAGTVFLVGGYLLVYWRRQRRLGQTPDQGSAA
jgi:protein SCO1/2